MQKSTSSINRVILENLMWFLGSLALAFLVWLIATAQLNPVEEWRFREAIPIRVTPDDGLVITNEEDFARTASVLVRAQQSIRELLAADDILVTADLSGLGPGVHVVELEAQVARPATILGISPVQITVNLEAMASKLVEVRARFTGDVAGGYAVQGSPQFDVNQVTVSGPVSLVEQVAVVEVEVNLDGQQSAVQDVGRPIPVDADGNPVADVSVDTQIIGVNVEVGREVEN